MELIPIEDLERWPVKVIAFFMPFKFCIHINSKPLADERQTISIGYYLSLRQ